MGNERKERVRPPHLALGILFLPRGPDGFFPHFMGTICSIVLDVPEQEGLDPVSLLEPHWLSSAHPRWQT